MSSSHFSTHPEIDGLTLFEASAGPHLHDPHEHDAYSVIMLTEGSKVFHHMGKSLTVSAGEIAVANPGQMHGCGPIDNQDWAHRTWYISQPLMLEMAESLGIEAQVVLEYPVIKNKKLFKKLIKAHRKSSQGDILERQSLALERLTELVLQHAKSPEENSQVNEQVPPVGSRNRFQLYEDYLKDHLSQQVELKDLAKRAGIGRNQVIKDFRHITGVTPGKVFRQMRLDAAKKLLAEDLTLADVASSVGFSDQSHFTRCFRKAYGLTPKQFSTLSKQTVGPVSL